MIRRAVILAFAGAVVFGGIVTRPVRAELPDEGGHGLFKDNSGVVWCGGTCVTAKCCKILIVAEPL